MENIFLIETEALREPHIMKLTLTIAINVLLFGLGSFPPAGQLGLLIYLSQSLLLGDGSFGISQKRLPLLPLLTSLPIYRNLQSLRSSISNRRHLACFCAPSSASRREINDRLGIGDSSPYYNSDFIV